MTEFADRLLALVGHDVPLRTEQVSQLEQHFELLRRWNRKLNLTAVRDKADAIERHYAESAYFGHVLGTYVSDTLGLQAATAADVGSGAGFPGFVLAVLYPSWTVALLESHRRKAVFLAEATRRLENVRVVSARAEDVSERFDCVVSRAVRPNDVLAVLPRLGRLVGLLVSAAQAKEFAASAVRWDVAVPLPWAPTRVALIGVPRETLGNT
ncbi:MAG TPA: 16S rRNA (guanine(527)-N(7))-methyltransferase RsmG [Bryobacteraceae bacterium]|nr:16S rRNA (guanine(527)-N(7))-methyltransferase RsmG [Bryobacteraceae bacterium]